MTLWLIAVRHRSEFALAEDCETLCFKANGSRKIGKALQGFHRMAALEPPRRAIPHDTERTMTMKSIATLCVTTMLAVPAIADTASLGGCATIDKGGYSVKADPTCVYSFDKRSTGTGSTYDADRDPTTPADFDANGRG